ncbi:MAG: PIN domain protein [Ignavibacteriae bacterium]|nr:PIN domain protein [Ignavibacteriota bacterium]
MIKRVYVDNSVIGGKHDPEFSNYTEKLFREFRAGLYIPVVSNITANEIQGAPAEVIKTFNALFEIAEAIELNEEAVYLAQRYIQEGKFSKRMLTDALHIATASVHRVDILVSWNFRDVVNLNKIVLYHAVNLKMGYPQIEIRNPQEILHE